MPDDDGLQPDDRTWVGLPPLQTFHPGELVRLKSGGPWMTVNSVYDDQTVEWYWFDPEEAFYAVTFAIAGLTQAPD